MAFQGNRKNEIFIQVREEKKFVNVIINSGFSNTGIANLNWFISGLDYKERKILNNNLVVLIYNRTKFKKMGLSPVKKQFDYRGYDLLNYLSENEKKLNVYQENNDNFFLFGVGILFIGGLFSLAILKMDETEDE